MYFDEWYLNVSDQEQAYYRHDIEDSMKSNLYFPETANFSNNWQFVCNLFYTSVQGYVDSKSPQGGIIRNEFEFIYYSFAGEKLLARVIFDNEVVADFGYVPTAELVAQLVADAATP